MKNKNLYPVVLLLNGGDSFEVLEVKWSIKGDFVCF